MKLDRNSARWIIVLLVLAGLAWVEATLWGHHYYRLTWAACRRLAGNRSDCVSWLVAARLQALVVVILGATVFFWNERRAR